MIRKEFRKWIIDDIKDRLAYHNYPPMTDEMFEDLSAVMDRHTNDEYEGVSDSLTNDIEKTLVKHGVYSADAIRMAWKWSD